MSENCGRTAAGAEATDLDQPWLRTIQRKRRSATEIHYGVVQIDGAWLVISDGLRSGPYPSKAEAEQVARRMADEAAGLAVQIHLQDASGELHCEQQGGADEAS